MASSSFRDSINSLGWSRRGADAPVSTAPQGGFLSSLQSLNPFGDGGYVQLPTTEGPGAPLPAPNRREEEEGWFACESTPVFLDCLPTDPPRPRPPLGSFPPRDPVCRFPCRCVSLGCRTCAGPAWPPCLNFGPTPRRLHCLVSIMSPYLHAPFTGQGLAPATFWTDSET